jgi:hypothetical protein
MSTKSHIHEMYGTLKKTSFCTKVYAEIHMQRPFFDIEKGIWKILRLKIQTMCSCFGAPSFTHGIFFFEKNQNLNFWWDFKVSWTNCPWADFGRFWVVLGRIGQILLHWQWLSICPNFTWNFKNLITFEP